MDPLMDISDRNIITQSYGTCWFLTRQILPDDFLTHVLGRLFSINLYHNRTLLLGLKVSTFFRVRHVLPRFSLPEGRYPVVATRPEDTSLRAIAGPTIGL